MRFFFATTAVATLVATAAGLPLLWDGSLFLLETLNTRSIFIAHYRFIDALFEIPMLLAANVTTDLHILGVVFNLSYTLIPLISIGLSWWIVRKTAPALIVWPVLGIGLLLVSGQIFFIIETIAVVELFWPILLALLVRPPRKMNFIIALLAIIIAFSHLLALS